MRRRKNSVLASVDYATVLKRRFRIQHFGEQFAAQQLGQLSLKVQPRSVSKQKDKAENYLAGKVRRGEMSLPEAQSLIQNWQLADTAR